jgi:protein-S-isoprenylcysteine O-methyltransferase Ste14
MKLETIIGVIIPTLWLAWLLYWWYSARNVKPARWREPLKSALQHRVPIILAAILLAAPRWVPRVLTRRFLPVGGFFPVLGTVVLAAGLGFSVWARRHLGSNWSSHVVVKENHALVRTGPYQYVRHPIYTGILLAFLGMVVTIGEWRGVLALPLALLAFARKSRAEEARMRQTFPEYEQYQRETAALIPFVY